MVAQARPFFGGGDGYYSGGAGFPAGWWGIVIFKRNNLIQRGDSHCVSDGILFIRISKCSTGINCYPAGSYTGADYSCPIGPAGKYSPFGSRICDSCPTGKYSTAGATSCMPCPSGIYSSSSGLSTCVACGDGSYANSDGASLHNLPCWQLLCSDSCTIVH